MKKRWLRLILLISAAVVFILLLSVSLLHSPPVRRLLFEQVRNRLRINSALEIEASNFRFNLLRGEITLENLIVRSTTKPGLPPIFRAKQVYVKLDYRSFMEGLRHLVKLQVTAPEVHYVIGLDGKTNLPEVTMPSGPAAEYLITQGEIRDGSFQYEDLRNKIALSLPRWRLLVEGSLQDRSHKIHFSNLQKSSFKYQSYTFPVEQLRLSGTLQQSTLLVEQAYLAAANSQLAAKGSINNLSNPEVRLQIKPNLDLNAISQALGLRERMKGTLTGIISADGNLDDLQIDARLRGTSVSALGYEKLSFDSRSRAELDSRRILLHSMEIDSPQGSVRGSANLSLARGQKSNSVDANIRDFELSPLWQQLRPPFDLSSRATGRISLRWDGSFNPSKLTGSAQLNLTATRATPSLSLLPLSGALDAQIRPGSISGNLQQFAALRTQISGPFSLRSFHEIEGDFHGEASDIDVLISQLSQFLGGSENPLAGMRISGPLQFSAHTGGSLTDPTITISVATPKLQAGIFQHLNAKTDAMLRGSQITFQSTITGPRGANVIAQGAFELSGSDSTLNLDAFSDNIPARAVGAMLDSSIPISGELKVELHLSGALDNLAGNASIRGDTLTLYGEPLGHLDTAMQLANKEIRSTQVRLLRDPQKPDSDRIDASFTYAVDSDHFQFEATGKELGLKYLTLPDGSHVDGTMNLAASGSGTVTQPSIDLKLEAKDIQLRQKSLGPVSLNAALRNERLTLEAAMQRFNISSTAHIINKAPYPFDWEFHVGNSDLSPLGLKAANGQALTGMLDAHLTSSGNLKEMSQAHLSVQLQKLSMRAGDIELHTQDPIEATYHSNSLEISSATIVSGNSKINIAGRVPLQQQAPEGNLSIKGQLDLSQAAAFLPLPKEFATAGMMDLDLSLAGRPQDLTSSGSIAVNAGVLELPGVPTRLRDITIRANVDKGSLILNRADAAWGEGQISLTAELPFGLLPKNIPVQFPRKQGPARFSLDMKNIELEATGKLPQGVNGIISLHAGGEASALNLRALKAQIDVSDWSFQASDLSFSQKQPSLILVQDGIASISRLSFKGVETSVEASGSAGLLPNSPLNLHLDGNLNAALLTYRNRDLKASGQIKIALIASGSDNGPAFSGHAEMIGGKFTFRNPRIVADSMTVRLMLDSNKISIQECKGTLNGGPMIATGTIGYRGGLLNDVNLKVSGQDFFFNFPNGLKSSSTGDLSITSSNDTVLISGNVRIQESSYRESFEVGSQLMSYIKKQQIVIEGRDTDPLLDQIRLDIAIHTDTPLLVQNNIAKVEANANLRLVGPYREPSMVGRITLIEGGTIVLNQRIYYIDRGVITLANQNQIEPELDIQAQTKSSNYDITLRISGKPERITTTLTSEPPLSQADILSLLLTGKTTSESQGREVETARTQALALLAGQAGEQLTGEARQALHLSTLRIDPGMAASESDQGARLTIGEDVTRDLSLIYSMNLTNGGDQIWAAQYEIVRRLKTQATKQQDNTYRLEFQHDLVFGGPSNTSRAKTAAPKFEIGAIRFDGGAPFSDKELLDNFKVKPSQKYDFQKIQKGLDRLHDFYAKEKHLEADIRMHRETQGNAVDLNLNIEPGPVVAFSFEGTPVSSKVKEEVEKAWKDGAFDVERVEDAVRAIRMPLLKTGYLQSQVANKIETGEGHKAIHFLVDPGAQYSKVPIVFAGNSEIGAAALTAAVDLANLGLDVYADPQKVIDYLTLYYRERGYLQVRVHSPDPHLNPQTGTGQIVIQIQEGPLFIIGDLEFSGNHAFKYDELWSVIPTSSGSSYDPNTLRDATKALENLYRSKGYNDVSVTFRVTQDSSAARANLSFYIVERRQSVIRDIVIEGTQGTSQDFVRRQLDFNTGDALDVAKIDETRKRLYSTSIYSSVDFQTEELKASSPDTPIKDVRIRIRVREIKPYRVQYGLFYDTERGIGGILEAENRNLLGTASDLGLKLRYDADLKEGRLYFYQPFVTNLHLKLDASAFVQSESRPGFSADRIGFSIFQQRRLPRIYRLDYGYRYDHVHWNGLPTDPTLFQADVPVARLIATLTRDTRDSVLDATRGEFSSHTLEFGPKFVGSEIGFSRYYGQYFRYVALDKFVMKPQKEKKPSPPRLVFASALRLGLTSAFGGQDVISPERFFAGGGTTMRGFEQDMLGPLTTQPDGTKTPIGGEALLLFNNEIRFPIFGILYGVGFVDIGNVYRKISDFDFSVRKSAGFGLRLKIKYIPIRIDYGLKLDRKPGESQGAFFFSIGQAF